MNQAVKSPISENSFFGEDLYQQYNLDEEQARIASHYDIESEFFITITGGEWNNYSCSIFEPGDTLTQAQERRLDEFARLMQLKPGMRILDIGCGWGGPLVYLCQKYGVTGTGITVTPAQIPYAEKRAQDWSVNASFVLSHWETFEDAAGFDAIFTDEVVVHVNDFHGFFKKCHALLKEDGILVNKELHLSSPQFKDWTGPIGRHVNGVFGNTGNYRLIEEEIEIGLSNGFTLDAMRTIDISHYVETVGKHWIPNYYANKEKLISLTSSDHVKQFYKYLRCTLVSFKNGVFTNHMLAFKKKGI
jgi:cyclopropane-fatty-acyl-phospholipid synthase